MLRISHIEFNIFIHIPNSFETKPATLEPHSN